MIKNLMVRRNAFNGETFIFSEADMDCVAGVPIWAQRLLFAALAPLARWRGYQVVIGPTMTVREGWDACPSAMG